MLISNVPLRLRAIGLALSVAAFAAIGGVFVLAAWLALDGPALPV